MTETLSPLLSDEDERRLETILRALRDGALTLATTESCTGGLLSSLFTDVEGCGHIFEAGFVTYSNEAKSRILGIDPALIERVGAVSRDVALAMAHGARERSGADIALATTGFTGKAGADGEAGLVHFACAIRDRPTLHAERHFHTEERGKGRRMALSEAIAMLQNALDATTR